MDRQTPSASALVTRPGSAVARGVSSAPDRPSTGISLEDAQARLKSKAQQLADAKPADIPQLTIDVQLYRVLCMLLRESASNVFDPNTYREMSLLNRMIKVSLSEGDPEESEKETLDEKAKVEVAQQRLIARGVSPQGAAALVRVLQAAQAQADRAVPASELEEDLEVEEPEPA